MPTFDARFVARVSGIPRPQVEWFFNDRPLAPGKRHLVKRDSDLAALYVLGCSKEDAGVYSCIARNDDGQAKCSATLDVVDRM